MGYAYGLLSGKRVLVGRKIQSILKGLRAGITNSHILANRFQGFFNMLN